MFQMDFTDIIKFFNEMAERHSAKQVLSVARELVFQLQCLNDPVRTNEDIEQQQLRPNGTNKDIEQQHRPNGTNKDIEQQHRPNGTNEDNGKTDGTLKENDEQDGHNQPKGQQCENDSVVPEDNIVIGENCHRNDEDNQQYFDLR